MFGYTYDEYCSDDDRDYVTGTELDDLRDLYCDLVDFTRAKPDEWAQDNIDDQLKKMGQILKMHFDQIRGAQ